MKHLHLARTASYSSTAKQQKMAAVVVRGGKVLSIATNHAWNHCEARALRPHTDWTGADIFVMRSNGRCSRPCKECQQKIIEAGIDRCYYVSLGGNVVMERFKR